MLINNTLSFSYRHNPVPDSSFYHKNAQAADSGSGKAVIADISPKAWEAYARSRAQPEDSAAQGEGQSAITGAEECETCKNRKYKDSSNDLSVSFQTPAHIGPGQAAATVATHENEHVSHEQAKAEQDGRKIISQTVTLKMSACPECGRIYVSGGNTRTLSVKNNKEPAGSIVDIKV